MFIPHVQVNDIINQREKERRDRHCLNEEFSEALVKSGNVLTIEEARKQPRYLYCPCKKCNPLTF